jgi:HK97 gp10 family phage protein
MTMNAKLEIKLNRDAKRESNDAVFEATRDAFMVNMLTDAVRNSPVAKGKTHGGKYVGGGTNKRSLTAEVRGMGRTTELTGATGTDKKGATFDRAGVLPDPGPNRVVASLYGQSGYSGYLELGTRKMEARPYIFPAFEKFKHLLTDLYAQRIARTQRRTG